MLSGILGFSRVKEKWQLTVNIFFKTPATIKTIQKKRS